MRNRKRSDVYMIHQKLSTLLFLFLLSCSFALVQCGPSAHDAPLQLVDWDEETLLKTRAKLEEGDTSLQPALDRLIEEAEQALQAGPFSVTDKPFYHQWG